MREFGVEGDFIKNLKNIYIFWGFDHNFNGKNYLIWVHYPCYLVIIINLLIERFYKLNYLQVEHGMHKNKIITKMMILNITHPIYYNPTKQRVRFVEQY